ncbi:MAG: hypothetical protein WAU16_14585 [Rhizobiaceae bacterium]
MRWIPILVAEARREMNRSVAYRFEFVADQALFVFGFLLLSGIFYILTDGGYTKQQQWMSLLGFVTWRVADGVMLRSVSMIDEETQWGTFEQIWLTATSPRLILLCRTIVVLVSYLLRAVLLGGILQVTLRIPMQFSASMVAVFLLSQFGVIGAAYILMGLQLTYKRVTSLTLAFSTSLLFVTGALAPYDNVVWLAKVVQFLPLGPGIHLLQTYLTQSSPIGWFTSEGIWLIVHSFIYFVIGQMVFIWGERNAQVRGSLGHY